MKIYLLSLLFLSALSGGILYLSEGKRYEKHLKYLSLLLILTLTLAPLGKLLHQSFSFSLETFPETSGDLSAYRSNLVSETEKNLEQSLKEQILSKTGLEDADFSLDIEISAEEFTLSTKSVTCTLFSLSAVAKREHIRNILDALSAPIIFKEELSIHEE